MAEKITDYTAKSQNFIDTDLFDVSKHVTQTSGVLVVGKRYTILDFNAGDNFTNVASVVSGTINTTGCVFDAIGTTPTTYSNGSTLAHYETQSYTYEDLKTGLNGNPKIYKALLTQSGTNAPVATVLVNTLSGTPVWSRNGVGDYQMVLSNAFVDFAKVYIPYSNDNTGNGYTITPVYNGASISGYYTFYISDPDTLILTTLDNTLTPIELGALIGTYFPVPPIEVYP